MSKYLGLLRWSLNYHDGTTNNVKPMDEERRAWLMEAIESHVVDPVEQMKNILEVLKLSKDETENKEVSEKQNEALGQLLDYIENFDLANDYKKLGGVEVVLDTMKSSNVQTRTRSLEVLSRLSQNHPDLQSYISQKNGLSVILECCNAADSTLAEKAKAIAALGSLIRGNEQISNDFLVKHKGLPLLFKLSLPQHFVDSPEMTRLIRKSLFLIQYFVDTEPRVRDPIKTTYLKDLRVIKDNVTDIDSKEIIKRILTRVE